LHIHTKLSGAAKGLFSGAGYSVLVTLTATDISALAAPAPTPVRWAHAPARPHIDVVLPVLNEEKALERGTLALLRHLRDGFPWGFRIAIADNASTDGTWRIAQRLAQRLPEVTAVHLDEKGRGRALRTVWTAGGADVCVYMDIDLSTDLAALLPLVAPLVSGHSDVAIGTRLAHGSAVVRGPKRETISRCYNLLTRLLLHGRFSDAQCGFKAIRSDRVAPLLPLIEDDGWFFDTELLVLAERAGLRIHEVPVDWVDDPDSRVAIVPTALADLKGIARLASRRRRPALPAPPSPPPSRAASVVAARTRAARRRPAPGRSIAGRGGLSGRLLRFCLIGAASTAAYAGLYLLVRSAVAAQWANGLALLITAIANTAANRRLTFAVRGTAGRLRHQGQGLVVSALGLAVTSGSLVLLHAADPHARHTTELIVLLAASVVATLLRFVLFSLWIFPQRGTSGARPSVRPSNRTPERLRSSP
jgi:putative flippase GtrA